MPESNAQGMSELGDLESRTFINQSFHSLDYEKLKKLGNTIFEQFEISANNMGFARNFLVPTTLSQSQSSPAFEIELIETYRCKSEDEESRFEMQEDIVQDAYIKCCGLMKQEDLIWLKKLQSTNNEIEVSWENWPNAFIKPEIRKFATGNFVISSQIWMKMISNRKFQEMFDPSIKIEDVKLGKMGQLLSLDVWTDSFRSPELRILENEAYVIAPKIKHGKRTLRPERVISLYNEDKTIMGKGSGFCFNECISQIINPDSFIRLKFI